LKSYIFEGLRKICNSKILVNNITDDKNQFYEILLNRLEDDRDDDIYEYLVPFGTFCDDFTIFSFLKNDEINILWKLNSTKTPFSDLNKQSTKVNYFKIEKDIYREKLNEIEMEILGNS
jgi:hypothetical protein